MTKYLKKLGKYNDKSVNNYQKKEINRLKEILEKYKQLENSKNNICNNKENSDLNSINNDEKKKEEKNKNEEKSENESEDFVITKKKDITSKNLNNGKLTFFNSNIILVSKQSINVNEDQNNFFSINIDKIEENIYKDGNEEEEYEEIEEKDEKEEEFKKEEKEKNEESNWDKYSEIEEEEESSEEI